MKLLKLSSDNPKFKTLEFKSGLNIVAGLQLSEEQKKTINGIGKSLSLKLIHYILGSSFKTPKEKKFEDFLKAYGTFQLDFIHKENKYSVKKDFSKSNFFINKKEMPQKKYLEFLNKIFLGDDAKIKFKQLFNVFARRFGGAYYADPLTQQGREKEEYHQKYINLYLLGIDTELVQKKKSIKEEISITKATKKGLEEQERSVNQANLKDLKEQLKKYKKRKDNFVIAENYDESKKEADNLTMKLNKIRDQIHEIKKTKVLKKVNLESSKNININIKEIEKNYHEAEFFFEDKIKKRLEDTQEFHNKLVAFRKTSLLKEIKDIEFQLENLKKTKEEVGTKRDERLKELNKQGAFEEYELLSNQIKSLEDEIKDTEKYKNILNEIKEKKINLDLQNAELKKESLSYLNSIEEKVNDMEESFRKLVKKFYDNTGGSFNITTTKDAQYLFDIELKIPKDESQGVGGVKIFCYDILLYQLNKGLLNFIAHDGCIFSGIDPRQQSMIFKVILEIIEKEDLQYFINIGENSLNEVLDKDKKINILTKKQKEQIEKAQILKLYDNILPPLKRELKEV